MSLASWWRRFDAARWMYRLLVLQTIAAGWWTAVIAYLGLFSGQFARTPSWPRWSRDS